MSKDNKFKISWLGIDGFLVALYFVVCGVIYYAIKSHNDFIVGRLIPYGIMIAVTLIFINYLTVIFKFVRPKKVDSKVDQSK